MGLHAAVESAVGYYFQGAYALVRLLDVDDEDAAISVETDDDVVLEGPNPTLHQLKHSASPGTLSEANDGLWKTLRIWAKLISPTNTRFQFVTTASIKGGSSLLELTKEEPDYQAVRSALDAEAKKVKAKREDDIKKSKEPRYKERWPGCEAYLGLSSDDRLELLRRIRIAPCTFSASAIPNEVKKRLTTIPHERRMKVTERLIEWWDRQVALSLLKKRDRIIKRSELLFHLNDINLSFTDGICFTDDYSQLLPPQGIEPSRRLRKQIELVKGNERLVERAKVQHWRARSQREKWISDGIPAVDLLRRFDQQLVEEWRDKHEELREKVSNQEPSKQEQEACAGGRALLDWTHNDAPQVLPPIRKDWNQPHLVRGSYQLLAEQLTVGWHPDFKSLMAAGDDESGR